jgi:hypothetical protein
VEEEAFQRDVCECSSCGTSYLTVLSKCTETNSLGYFVFKQSINHSNKNIDIKFSTHKAKIFESLIIEKIFGIKKINAAVLLLPKCYTIKYFCFMRTKFDIYVFITMIDRYLC